jgi:hypothetical protein
LLHVSSSPQNQARFERTGASTVQIEFHDSTTTNQPSLGGDGDNLTFRTSFAERMRLDASGNLLVGKTSAGSSNVGVELRPQGYIFGTGDGINPLRLNRKTSDGMIADFQKDGTTVGSIGAVAGDIVIGTGACGIRFHDGTPALQPRNTDGSANNDAIDIGLNGNRFKNLYLSNTVNVGSNTTISPDGSNGQIKQASGILYYKSGQHNFQNAAGTSEYARFDSSGNLLVGTTDAAPWDNTGSASGAALRADGRFSGAVVGGEVILLNRLSTDGVIADFRKDGSTVGNIGYNTGAFTVDGAASRSGLYFGNGALLPRYNGALVDGANADLGATTQRFKDLYLSGASLAGAGSASSPSISFSGDTNTGLYSISADNIGFATGGTARAFISGTQFNMTGNGVFSGSLTKGSGSFKIDHPLPAKTNTHHLVHSFVEAPQADNIYRGVVDLVDGSATINIDIVAGMTEGTFVLLNTNLQCFTSNESGWTAVKGSVSGNTLTITAQDNTCTDTISWMVVGERHDQHMIDTEWTDSNGKVIVEPLKETN